MLHFIVEMGQGYFVTAGWTAQDEKIDEVQANLLRRVVEALIKAKKFDDIWVAVKAIRNDNQRAEVAKLAIETLIKQGDFSEAKWIARNEKVDSVRDELFALIRERSYPIWNRLSNWLRFSTKK